VASKADEVHVEEAERNMVVVAPTAEQPCERRRLVRFRSLAIFFDDFIGSAAIFDVDLDVCLRELRVPV